MDRLGLESMWGHLPQPDEDNNSAFKILKKQSLFFNKNYKSIKTKVDFVPGLNNTQSVFRYKFLLYTNSFSFEILYVVYGAKPYPCRLRINKVIYKELYEGKNRLIYVRNEVEFKNILEKVLTSKSLYDIIQTLM